MNKEQAYKRLDAIEREAKELREIIGSNEPEKREPKPGDIWSHNTADRISIVDTLYGYTYLQNGLRNDLRSGKFSNGSSNWTYLGKFQDVFVRKDKVIEALSFKDESDNSISMKNYGAGKTLQALRSLGLSI